MGCFHLAVSRIVQLFYTGFAGLFIYGIQVGRVLQCGDYDG
jgi:hypothetical protein